MGSFSAWHWLIVLAVIMLLFGRGRISALLADIGKGIGGFRREARELSSGQDAPRRVPVAVASPAPVHPGGDPAASNDGALADGPLSASQPPGAKWMPATWSNPSR
ncbi:MULTISPECIES: twin-arginine translocase TatA/TatE family subunit [unclassified Mesorhizobium]|uniref:twin-arginine translocase TatA/TatE family subunit n=1 Tax=unclassified Mesorhizobium TaxID=325217 RepID=UPI000FD222CF|nr:MULTISPECIES: twin-arginine translocase TatA/TatE family subunit [unclassified Mesorhizobium]RUW18967.1 twin-arginine translocase TatA/TatE family subunit [Mesorhizobium sp. M4B.F.Ca.ET.013.02.1.1]TGV22700.1 twin-arginine translocase TatA/TatE family subunit [Mesorhizobium sp. M4B.F.Ca.ET.143.01.1.1]